MIHRSCYSIRFPLWLRIMHFGLLTVFFFAVRTASETPPIVRTSLGSIRGLRLHVLGKEVTAFLGIPYAESPVSDLRFRKPKPKPPWTGVLDATKLSVQCPQSRKFYETTSVPFSADTSEDCLYLNVWTPAVDFHGNVTGSLAVMVWIHGGGFKMGSASTRLYDGRVLASLGDVVFVSMNYRLGLLGFMNFGTEDSPGNQGLLDQRMALTWIKDHIADFGGDPDRVTIFGVSAGSMAVGMHLLSPGSRGLYRRAIMQSGGPVNRVFLQNFNAARQAAHSYAAAQGCRADSDNDTSSAISCLRNLPVEHITKSEDAYFEKYIFRYFSPTVGDDFLPEFRPPDPPVELFVGVNANEGTFLAILLMMMRMNVPPVFSDFTMEDAKYLSNLMIQPASQQEIEEVVRFYFGHLPNTGSSNVAKTVAADVMGDSVLACPTVLFAQKFAVTNPVRFYHFNHRPSNSPAEEWVGVAHFDEVQFVFGLPFVDPDMYTAEEAEFSGDIIRMWTQFAKTGVPLAPGLETWPLYSEDYPVYVDLKPDNYSTGIGPRLRNCNFWRCRLQPPLYR